MDSDHAQVIERRLAEIIALLRIAHGEAIDKARDEVRSDSISRALLDFAQDPVPSGQLSERVAKKTGAGKRTVDGRLAELADRGLLRRIRDGNKTLYESAGVL